MIEQKKAGPCPHLGLFDDPTTILSFPGRGNFCHAHGRCASIALDHQERYCLTERHVACPVWREQPDAQPPLPVESMPDAAGLRRRWLQVAALALILALVLVAIGSQDWEATADFSPESSVESVIPEESPTALPLPTTMLVVVEPPSIPEMTATPTAATPTPAATFTPLPSETPAPSPTAAPTLEPTPTAAPLPQALVVVARLNARSGPATLYESLTIVNLDEQFDIVGRNNAGDWWQVCCMAGQPAWLFGESIQISGDTADVPIIVDIPPPGEQ